MTQETATYFVTYKVSLLGELQERFLGRGITFGVGKANGTECIHVTIPTGDLEAESALLGEIYQATSAIRRNAKQASKGV